MNHDIGNQSFVWVYTVYFHNPLLDRGVLGKSGHNLARFNSQTSDLNLIVIAAQEH